MQKEIDVLEKKSEKSNNPLEKRVIKMDIEELEEQLIMLGDYSTRSGFTVYIIAFASTIVCIFTVLVIVVAFVLLKKLFR